MFDICVRHLCAACVPADLGRFGWTSGVLAGNGRKKRGENGGYRRCAGLRDEGCDR